VNGNDATLSAKSATSARLVHPAFMNAGREFSSTSPTTGDTGIRLSEEDGIGQRANHFLCTVAHALGCEYYLAISRPYPKQQSPLFQKRLKCCCREPDRPMPGQAIDRDSAGKPDRIPAKHLYDEVLRWRATQRQ